MEIHFTAIIKRIANYLEIKKSYASKVDAVIKDQMYSQDYKDKKLAELETEFRAEREEIYNGCAGSIEALKIKMKEKAEKFDLSDTRLFNVIQIFSNCNFVDSQGFADIETLDIILSQLKGEVAFFRILMSIARKNNYSDTIIKAIEKYMYYDNEADGLLEAVDNMLLNNRTAYYVAKDAVNLAERCGYEIENPINEDTEITPALRSAFGLV